MSSVSMLTNPANFMANQPSTPPARCRYSLKIATIITLYAGFIGFVCLFGLNQLALAANPDKTQDSKNKPTTSTTTESKSTSSPSTPQPTSQEKPLIASIETNLGTMKISLFYQQTPITVSNFVTLAQQGFYNDVTFHRVIKNFMIQGGDPKGTGTGGPGYSFQDEFVPALKHHKKGILSMANAGPNTNGSQFFITLVPTPHLDGKHTVFGELTEGEDVLDKIGSTPTGSQDKPTTPVVIKKISFTGDFKPIEFKKNSK